MICPKCESENAEVADSIEDLLKQEYQRGRREAIDELKSMTSELVHKIDKLKL